MKLVKVLRPFGPYVAGDTPTLMGSVARDRRESGDVEWLDGASDVAAVEPAAEAPTSKPVITPTKPARSKRKG